jgi:hypothetical protein
MKILKTKKYSILSNIRKFSFVAVFMLMLVTPLLFASAIDTVGTEITTKIVNPLGDKITDIPSFIEALIQIVLIVGIPIIALAIIYTGFLFVQAQGNPEKITEAKKALLYTLIGAVLLLGAFVIANAIGKTVEEIKSTSN